MACLPASGSAYLLHGLLLWAHIESPSHISNLSEHQKSILCRGAHSLETICLLLALKIEHPRNVHLIRGNHEASDINALFGFRIECIERLGDPNGIWAWQRLNALFNWLPLAATIEEKVLCMHGGESKWTAKKSSLLLTSALKDLNQPLEWLFNCQHSLRGAAAHDSAGCWLQSVC